MLHRWGCKKRFLPLLIPFFPIKEISLFIDLFMGSGAVSFALADRIPHIIANDKDEEIFNLFMILKERKEEFLDLFSRIPYHESLLDYWKIHREPDPLWKAARFLFLSNFSIFGIRSSALCFGIRNSFALLLEKITEISLKIQNIQFMCVDFREVLAKVHFRREKSEKKRTFIYADPPYMGIECEYGIRFDEKDTRELIEMLICSGIRFALSEYNRPETLSLLKEYNLQIFFLGKSGISPLYKSPEYHNEILALNYDPRLPKQLDLFKGGFYARSCKH